MYVCGGGFANFPLCNLSIYLENVGLCCIVSFYCFCNLTFSIRSRLLVIVHQWLSASWLAVQGLWKTSSSVTFSKRRCDRTTRSCWRIDLNSCWSIRHQVTSTHSKVQAGVLLRNKWRGWWNLISKWELITVLIVLQKSCLTPQWQVGCLTLRWSCILHCLFIFIKFSFSEWTVNIYSL